MKLISNPDNLEEGKCYQIKFNDGYTISIKIIEIDKNKNLLKRLKLEEQNDESFPYDIYLKDLRNAEINELTEEEAFLEALGTQKKKIRF